MKEEIPQVLVTGGGGFVGRNLIKHLLGKPGSKKIWVIDDLSTGLYPTKWPEIDCEQIHNNDLISKFRIRDCSSELIFLQADATAVFLSELKRIPSIGVPQLPRFDQIFHLASIVGGRRKIEEDPLAVGIDLAIDSSFYLWAAKVNEPKRILYASSSAAYPIGLQVKDKDIALKESMIDFSKGFMAPDFTYGWSKLTGEYLSKIAAEKYKLKVAVIRPFSGYGEYQEPVYPVPAIAMRAAARYNPLYVWGTGEQARDFVHIEDCIIAMEKALETIEDGSGINIGTGVATSFLELASLMADIVGYSPEVTGLSGKPVGVARRFCDPELMKNTLAFYPSISLREGITRVLDVAGKRLESGVDVPL